MNGIIRIGRIIRLKRRINACALTVIAWLFAGIAVAAPTSDDSDRIAQLLDQTGVRALLEQTPAVLAAAIEAETQFLQTSKSPPPANWRRGIETQLKPQTLIQNVAHYLREHDNADIFQRAQQRLQEPLAKRARYFDLAMTQPGAEKNLREFFSLNEHKSEDSTAEARRAVLRDIDTASATSLLTATLQSAIAARVDEAAGQGAIDADLLKDAIAERQRFLAPLTADYLLYDYRYLRDDELRDYRDLLRDDAVQALLEMSRQAVLAAIVGDVVSSSVTQQPLKPLPNQPR
jgi:hypothetical protein